MTTSLNIKRRRKKTKIVGEKKRSFFSTVIKKKNYIKPNNHNLFIESWFFNNSACLGFMTDLPLFISFLIFFNLTRSALVKLLYVIRPLYVPFELYFIKAASLKLIKSKYLVFCKVNYLNVGIITEFISSNLLTINRAEEQVLLIATAPIPKILTIICKTSISSMWRSIVRFTLTYVQLFWGTN